MWSVGTLLLSLFSTAYAVTISFVNKFFWNALSAKDLPQYSKFLAIYLFCLTIGPPFLVLYDWFKSRMSLAWRTALTERYLNNYVSRKNYYKIPIFAALDNADQRIADDIRCVTDKSVSLLCTVFVAACDLVVFSAILYRIDPFLYALLFAYSAAGTAFTIFVGRPLITLNREQLRREADFRYGLVRLRENAESVAFYNGDRSERRQAVGLFGALAGNAARVMDKERTLGFFTRWYKYLIQALPALVIGPQYFAGKIQLGVISQTFVSFNHVLADLSLVVSEFAGPQGLSNFAAGVGRLRQLQRAIDETDARDAAAAGESKIEVGDAAGGGLALEGLTVETPTAPARRLVEALSLRVEPGQRVLVVGDSGIGKSSLMRAIAGLWETGSGRIARPPPSETLFLAQRPYLTLGTLRENVLYPSSPADSAATDQEVEEALRRVNLGSLLARVTLDAPAEQLAASLSLGEQQRLAFARVLIAKPRLAILDESTSALDLDNERRMYALLEEQGTTVISVGNRPSLLQFHDTVLRIAGEGRWTVETPAAAPSPAGAP